jgi:hypothetical protein
MQGINPRVSRKVINKNNIVSIAIKRRNWRTPQVRMDYFKGFNSYIIGIIK